ncbi:MAG: thiol:disulfide interchange protein [Proteobacteria bacterium]|nr:thiol:disulfide interchange protein [Pseudomonadota bacterium]
MKVFSFFTLLFLLSSCSYKDYLKSVLMENPDILLDVMKKHQQQFATILASRPNRPTPEQEIAQREEEFKNPKRPEIEQSRAIRGKWEAPITIVAYSDFQCPFCARAEMNLEEVRKKYPQQLKYLFKHFPLPFHNMALPAAKTYEAIALQSKEKALKFQDEVFQNQPLLGQEKEAFLDKAAQKVGVNLAQMRRDRDSDKVQALVQKDMEEGRTMGVRGTPAFLINGVFLSGARPAKDFEDIIDRWLKDLPHK